MGQRDRSTGKTAEPAGQDGVGETIRTKDAAQRFQISRPFLYQLMARREIAYVQLGRHRRIVLSSLQAYLQKHLVPAVETAG